MGIKNIQDSYLLKPLNRIRKRGERDDEGWTRNKCTSNTGMRVPAIYHIEHFFTLCSCFKYLKCCLSILQGIFHDTVYNQGSVQDKIHSESCLLIAAYTQMN